MKKWKWKYSDAVNTGEGTGNGVEYAVKPFLQVSPPWIT